MQMVDITAEQLLAALRGLAPASAAWQRALGSTCSVPWSCGAQPCSSRWPNTYFVSRLPGQYGGFSVTNPMIKLHVAHLVPMAVPCPHTFHWLPARGILELWHLLP
jgi:hypothetical protein